MRSAVRPSRLIMATAVAALLATSVGCAGGSTVRTESAVPRAQPVRAELPAQANGAARPRVLFIRGAEGSAPAGQVPAPNDTNALSDIANLGNAPNNNGFGVAAKLMADGGYDVAQLNETGTRENRQKVDLKKANLKQYAVVIFGSNNARYDQSDAQTVSDYVNQGGGVLFLNDTNWGPDSSGVPPAQSDSDLLAPFGVQMNKDNGDMGGEKYAGPNDFAEPDHPILQGVDSFGGLGVSACTQLASAPQDVSILVRSKSPVHPVTGGERATTANDATLLVFEPGSGRGACFFDRDPFFNNNITQNSHERLATNLINWLAKR